MAIEINAHLNHFWWLWILRLRIIVVVAENVITMLSMIILMNEMWSPAFVCNSLIFLKFNRFLKNGSQHWWTGKIILKNASRKSFVSIFEMTEDSIVRFSPPDWDYTDYIKANHTLQQLISVFIARIFLAYCVSVALGYSATLNRKRRLLLLFIFLSSKAKREAATVSFTFVWCGSARGLNNGSAAYTSYDTTANTKNKYVINAFNYVAA